MPFKDSMEGGGFYTPATGMCVGEFQGVEDGPTLEFEGKPSPQMRWKWLCTNLDGTPILYQPTKADGTPDTSTPPIPAVLDALSTEATGTKSKARAWAKAHGATIEGMLSGAQFLAAVDGIKGRKVYLVCGPRDNGKQGLLNIMPMPSA